MDPACRFVAACAGRTRAPGSDGVDEKIGVRSILMRETRRRMCAVLGSFFAADRLLCQWSQELGGVLECQFEIVYSDGYRVSGDYRFMREGPRRPALTAFIRASAAGPQWFLDRYETTDCQ